ncbi:hypothetical protein TFLX_00762 [Thermoflexales bacterium]|nr:hypothetical protein TFLX_00762 [Thermoflexales bacterium]
MTADKLQLKLSALAREKDRPAEIQRCPICGGQLHVYFEAYKRGTRNMCGASAKCDGCGAAVAIDLGEPMPIWLSGNAGKVRRPKPK